MSGRVELDFLPNNLMTDLSVEPTDEQLLLQLVYGLCGQLNNPKEENSRFFISAVGIPLPFVRRVAKILATNLNLPIPPERVDEWVNWQRSNQCWIVDEPMAQEAKRLSQLTPIEFRDGAAFQGEDFVGRVR